MKLVLSDTQYLIKNIFHQDIIAGFTGNTISGKDPQTDVLSAVPTSKNKDLSVSWCRQPHAEAISVIDRPGIFPTDGLITSSTDCLLIIRTADCLPLSFCDQGDRIGILHLGWKSLAKGILNTLAGFLHGADAGKLTLVAGPGLRKCCYEVKEDFLATSLAQFVEQRKGKYFFNPIRCVKEQLTALKIAYDFHDTDICTFCDSRRFHSYRRDKTEKRILSFIVKR